MINNKKIFRLIFIFVIIFSSVSSYAAGQERASITLDDLIKETLEQNPQIKAAREEWKAAQKRVPQASSLPDPTAGYTYMGPTPDTLNGPEKDRYGFEQMIPFPGKLAGRRNVAKTEATAAEARMKQVEREIIFKISEA